MNELDVPTWLNAGALLLLIVILIPFFAQIMQIMVDDAKAWREEDNHDQ